MKQSRLVREQHHRSQSPPHRATKQNIHQINTRQTTFDSLKWFAVCLDRLVPIRRLRLSPSRRHHAPSD